MKEVRGAGRTSRELRHIRNAVPNRATCIRQRAELLLLNRHLAQPHGVWLLRVVPPGAQFMPHPGRQLLPRHMGGGIAALLPHCYAWRK